MDCTAVDRQQVHLVNNRVCAPDRHDATAAGCAQHVGAFELQQPGRVGIDVPELLGHRIAVVAGLIGQKPPTQHGVVEDKSAGLGGGSQSRPSLAI